MGWFRTILLWLFDAFKAKVEKDSATDIEGRLSQIQQRLDKIEKSPLPIGLACSGLPVMMIGLTGMIDSILNSENYQTVDFAYYSIGAFMVGLGLKFYYKRNREAFVTILSSAGILITVILIKVLVF